MPWTPCTHFYGTSLFWNMLCPCTIKKVRFHEKRRLWRPLASWKSTPITMKRSWERLKLPGEVLFWDIWLPITWNRILNSLLFRCFCNSVSHHFLLSSTGVFVQKVQHIWTKESRNTYDLSRITLIRKIWVTSETYKCK